MAYRFTARGIVIVRVLTALRALQTQRLTLAELAATMGTCQRTARRYVEALEEAHVPIQRHQGRYRIEGRI